MKKYIQLMFIVALSFIVRWTVVENTLTGCPQRHPSIDEYGITRHSFTTELVACYSTSRREMEKLFDNEVSADEFIKNMPLKTSPYSINSSYVENVEKSKVE